ncbi:MAG: hypothetical protein ABJF88_17145 [Rhodothermales bacterium]
MAVVLLVVHMTAWRAVRNAFVVHVAYPLVAAIDTERADGYALDAASYERTITATRTGGEEKIYRAPANMDYLLAALVLIAVFPRRPYWFWLWLAHLAVGGLALAAFALGVGWTDAGFAAETFLRVYAARAVSLLAVLAALAPAWAERLGLPTTHGEEGGR